MTARPLRAAIIGTGRIGSRLEKDPLRTKPHTHAGWYCSHPGIVLVAGADIDQLALAEFAADWHITADRCYSDYRMMLERERPDLVSICAYAPERVEMCEAAAAAGARGLWIEKAVACSLDEARRLQGVIARAGVAAVVDQPRRGDARYRAVRRLIVSGGLGRLETIHVLFSGQFLHTGTHAWDVLDFWCGPWESLAAWLEPVAPDASADGRLDAPGAGRAAREARASDDVDRGGHAILRFPGGCQAFVSGSRKQFFVFRFDLLFEGGRLEVGNDAWSAWRPSASPRYSGFLELAPVGTEGLVEASDHAPRTMLADLLHAVETGEEPLMSVRHAIAALETGIAAFQSHALGHTAVARGAVDPRRRVVSR